MGDICSKRSDENEMKEKTEKKNSNEYVVKGDLENEVNLKIVKAKLTSSVNWMEEMDPYVKFKYNGNKFRTKTRKGDHLRPEWNQVITFYFNEEEPKVRIRLNDDNDGDDTEIGITTLPLVDLWKTYNEEIKLPLERDGTSAGYLLVTILPPEEVPEKEDFSDKSGKMSKLEKEEEEAGVNPNSKAFEGYQPGAVFMTDPRMASMQAMQQQQMMQHQMMMMQMQQGGGYNPMMMNQNPMMMQQQMMMNNPQMAENPMMQQMQQGEFDQEAYKQERKKQKRRVRGEKSQSEEVSSGGSDSGRSGSEETKKKRRKQRKKNKKRRQNRKSDSSQSSSW